MMEGVADAVYVSLVLASRLSRCNDHSLESRSASSLSMAFKTWRTMIPLLIALAKQADTGGGREGLDHESAQDREGHEPRRARRRARFVRFALREFASLRGFVVQTPPYRVSPSTILISSAVSP